MNEEQKEIEREKLHKHNYKYFKYSLNDFRGFLQEAGHQNDTVMKALHMAYLKASETGAAVDFAAVGYILSGMINVELERETEECTEIDMEKMQ